MPLHFHTSKPCSWSTCSWNVSGRRRCQLQVDSCHIRTQVPSAAVVYTTDCSVGEARVRTAVGRKSCRCTDTLTLVIRLGSSENRHHTGTDFRFWDSRCFAPLFQALESNKGQSNIAGFLKIASSHVKSMSTGVRDISFQGRFTRCTFLIPFCTSMIIYEWFMNMCALCLFFKNPEGNPNQRCFVHPCHFAWSCVSLMSPTLAFQMSLCFTSGSLWKLRSTFAVLTGIFAPGMMLTSCWWTSLASQFIANIVRSWKLRVMFGSTSAGESRAIDLSCDQHDVTQWQNSKLAQQVACFVQCQSYQIWFVVGLWQFVNVCLMKDFHNTLSRCMQSSHLSCSQVPAAVLSRTSRSPASRFNQIASAQSISPKKLRWNLMKRCDL